MITGHLVCLLCKKSPAFEIGANTVLEWLCHLELERWADLRSSFEDASKGFRRVFEVWSESPIVIGILALRRL